MKIQMVIMANACEHRGRSLLGILLQDGKPVFRNGRPHWLRPVMDTDRHHVPSALVVDLIPFDVVEVDLLDTADLEDPEGWLQVDFYSLRIKGRLDLDSVVDCCWMPSPTVIWENAIGDGQEAGPCLLLASECTVISTPSAKEDGQPLIEMRFGYNGVMFQFQLTDPQLLASLEVEPDMLGSQQSVQLVLAPSTGKRMRQRKFRVVSVLV